MCSNKSCIILATFVFFYLYLKHPKNVEEELVLNCRGLLKEFKISLKFKKKFKLSPKI